ncbi:MAG: DUF4091 domain-containing protein [Bacteroidales bacterium]|nr:DUF4091 domain-containing protein [Bacteroidales bacterium]
MRNIFLSLISVFALFATTATAQNITWIDADVHYPHTPASDVTLRTDTTITAWRGERIGMRGMIVGKSSAKAVQLRVDAAPNAPEAKASWLCDVLTDSFSTCGYHPDSLEAYNVAEVIDLPGDPHPLAKGQQQTFWVSVEIPRDAAPGTYHYTLTTRGAKAKSLTFRVNVVDRQLPAPHDYTFHLDLWQQPYSVARYHNVQPWSQEHLDHLRPYMKELARLGQKVVSAILFYEPWGQQSNDKFQPMIQVTKHTATNGDTTWSYDYTIFDRWVEFMAECGIDQQIDCYSMVPWDMTFRYYDEARRDTINLKTTTDTPEYRDLWISYLRDFAAHLKDKGWFDKTAIAMDERGLDDMLRAYHVAQYAVPGMKMTLAGNRHKPLVDLLYDYSVAYGQEFTPEERAERLARGQHSTYYTCCTDAHPGLFSNSNPVDATFIPLYALAADFDGWLHWSWLNWTDDPLHDSRFFLFAPGDTYFFYPGPRSSLRHERLLEGIQQFEKVAALRAEGYPDDRDGQQQLALRRLFDDIKNEPAQDPLRLAELLARLKSIVNTPPAK